MSHYFGVVITEEPNLHSVCDILDEFAYDNGCGCLDGVFDYYMIGEHPDDRIAVRYGGVGYVVSLDKSEFKIGSNYCDCVRACDADWGSTNMKLPYLCFMPDGCYWKWSKMRSLENEEWAEVKQQAIKNGWYITIFDFHL